MIEEIILKEKKIILIGTAHVSKASIDEVESAIDTYQPDKVAVELCQSRYNSINSSEKWKNMNLYSISPKEETVLSEMISTVELKKIKCWI